MLYDGLSEANHCGCVYGNPPYDGRGSGGGTIRRLLDMAEGLSVTKRDYRAVFFLPLTPENLRARLRHPHCELVMFFPNRTVPFIPSSFWRTGGPKFTGRFYDEENTNLVILKYEHPISTTLSVINYDALHRKLANWFLSVIPPEMCTDDCFALTNVPVSYFHSFTGCSDLPDLWKFWNPRDLNFESYPGASQDGQFIGCSPFHDTLSIDHKLTLVGIPPRHFDKVLKILGHKSADTYRICQSLVEHLKTHTIQTLKLYRRLSASASRVDHI